MSIRETATRSGVDAFTAEVIRSTVVAITDEMKTNLMRTAYNMIIYEAEDFTVGLFDSDGNTISIGLGLPMFIRGLSDAITFVFADGSGSSVQVQLLARGQALVSAEVIEKGCAQRETIDLALKEAEVDPVLMEFVSVEAVKKCVAAGLGWATACDFRFATAEARFNTAFLSVGVSSDMGPPWFLDRIVGGARAREMLFFPAKLTGEEALKIDLVTRLFPRGALPGDMGVTDALKALG